MAMKAGYPPDISSYLFGSILSVTRLDLVFIAVLTFAVVLTFIALYADWTAYLFDDEFAAIAGVNVRALENLLMALIAVTVVVLIRVVGIILVLALLTAPAATAALFTARLRPRLCCRWASPPNTASGAWLSLPVETTLRRGPSNVGGVYLLAFCPKGCPFAGAAAGAVE